MKSSGSNADYLVCTYEEGAVIPETTGLANVLPKLKELEPAVCIFVRLEQRNIIKPSKLNTRNSLPTSKCGYWREMLTILALFVKDWTWEVWIQVHGFCVHCPYLDKR
jgi:hypothetical protein